MKENIEEDLKVMANIITHYIEADKCGLSNNDFKNEIKALSNILSDYKRLLKENEELKESNKILQECYWNECISKQKVKDKIEELKKKSGGNVFHIQQTINAEIRLLQELLAEER